MNKEQRKLFHETGRYVPDEPIFMPLDVPFIVSPTVDNIAHREVARPMSEKDCNGVSIQDLEALHKFRGMDYLHRPDAIAAEFNRGSRMIEHLNKVGQDQFIKDWFDFHNH